MPALNETMMVRPPPDLRPQPYNTESMDIPRGQFFSGTGHRLSDDSSARVGLAGSDDLPESEDPHFSVRVGWSRDKETVLEYLSWFQYYGHFIGARAQKSWNVTEDIFKAATSYQGDSRRPLQIHAYQKDVELDALQLIDVDTGIATTAIGARRGPMKQTTGCDLGIIGFLASQESVSYALRLAIWEVEGLELSEIGFTCQGATHRSVGCACLLALLFYPEAHLVFHTRNTIEHAKASNWCRLSDKAQ